MLRNPMDRPTQSIAGFTVGIIVADESMNLLPGNVANAATFPFPVLYEVLDGIPARDVMSGNPEVIDRIIEAGRQLEKRGVHAIAGACGSFANYQAQAAEAFRVPTFLSVMLQVPWILSGLRSDQKIGIIAAAASALTPAVFEQCAISDPARLVIRQAIDFDSFLEMARVDGAFRFETLADDLAAQASAMVAEHPEIAAFVLQCSDLPPFASAVQSACGLPVFDMTSLIGWVAGACHRRPFHTNL